MITQDRVIDEIFSFGVVPMCYVLKMYTERERFEEAAVVYKALKSHCEQYDIRMPGEKDDWYEEYEATFWRFNLSGETAVKNIPFYIIKIWSDFGEDPFDIIEFELKNYL